MLASLGDPAWKLEKQFFTQMAGSVGEETLFSVCLGHFPTITQYKSIEVCLKGLASLTMLSVPSAKQQPWNPFLFFVSYANCGF